MLDSREVYANWYLWALENLNTSDTKRCHAAAQAAIEAMRSGANAAQATFIARNRAWQLSALWATDRGDEVDRRYAEWFAWAVQVEDADPTTAHIAAKAVFAEGAAGPPRGVAVEDARRLLLTKREARLVNAARFLEYLQGGGRIQPIENPYFHRHPDEYIAVSVAGHRLEFFGTEESYGSGGLIVFGGPILTMATLGGSLAYSAHQKAQARARASERWRVVDSGTLHVTSQRLAFQGNRGWLDVPYRDVRASGCIEDAIDIALDGRNPLRLQVTESEFCFIAMRWLSGQPVGVEVSTDLREKAMLLGIWPRPVAVQETAPASSHPSMQEG